MYIKVVYNNGNTEYYTQESYITAKILMNEEDRNNHKAEMVFSLPPKSTFITLGEDGEHSLNIIN